jgi:bifunctional DNA-binding transcriptional regulator/antitoxin component of YhaV-PrlF toxin-antitoxin module
MARLSFFPMSDNVYYLSPRSRLDDVDRDMVELEIASLASHRQLESSRERVGKIIGADYMFALLEYLFSGKPAFPKGFDPTGTPFPYPYRHHLDLMEGRELEIFSRTISMIMKRAYDRSGRSRKELFFLRTEVMRRLAIFRGEDSGNTERPEFVGEPGKGGPSGLRIVHT